MATATQTAVTRTPLEIFGLADPQLLSNPEINRNKIQIQKGAHMTNKKASSTSRNTSRVKITHKKKANTAPRVHTKRDLLEAFRISEEGYQLLRHVADRPRLWERKGFSYDLVEYLVSRHLLRLRNYSRTAIITDFGNTILEAVALTPDGAQG